MPQRSHVHLRSSALFRRPLGRILGGGAIVTSLVLHGAAAALALVVLPSVMSRSEVRPQEGPAVVEINVVTPTEPEATPESPALPRATRRPAPLQRPRVATAPTLLVARPERAAPPEPESAPVRPDEPARPVVARFALSAGSIAGRSDRGGVDAFGSAAPADGAGHDAASATGEGAGPLPESAVDRPAQLVTTAPLLYPEAARRAELELDLPLEIVVSPQGRVRAALALAHPGYGLEEAALTAVRSYVFHPARRAGREVPVRMKWTMQFRLR